MRWEEVEVGEPKEGEIRVRNTAVGVNFIDVYFRKGVYPAPLPFTPGTRSINHHLSSPCPISSSEQSRADTQKRFRLDC